MNASTIPKSKTSLLRKTVEMAKAHPTATNLMAIGLGASITVASFAIDYNFHSTHSALIRTHAYQERQIEIQKIKVRNDQLIAQKKPLLDALDKINAQNDQYAKQISEFRKKDEPIDAEYTAASALMFVGFMVMFQGISKLKFKKKDRNNQATQQ